MLGILYMPMKPNLKFKTRPKQLLGQLVFLLPRFSINSYIFRLSPIHPGDRELLNTHRQGRQPRLLRRQRRKLHGQYLQGTLTKGNHYHRTPHGVLMVVMNC